MAYILNDCSILAELKNVKTTKQLYKLLNSKRYKAKNSKKFLLDMWGCCQDIARKFYRLDKRKGFILSVHAKIRTTTGSHIVYMSSNCKVYDPMLFVEPVHLSKYIKKIKPERIEPQYNNFLK